jgi:hypothetical protein
MGSWLKFCLFRMKFANELVGNLLRFFEIGSCLLHLGTLLLYRSQQVPSFE